MLSNLYRDWWSNLGIDAAIVLLAITLDRLLPEPTAAIHPVVWKGARDQRSRAPPALGAPPPSSSAAVRPWPL